MAGKWNLRIKGIKINNIQFPVLVIYFNLGYAISVNDVLNFGLISEWAQDLQIRIGTIGTSWDFLTSARILLPSDLSFSNENIYDGEQNLRITQTVTNDSQEMITTAKIYHDTDLLGFSFSLNSGTGGQAKETFSPVIILHDEFADKLMCVSGASYSPVFYSWDGEVIKSIAGFPNVNQFPAIWSVSGWGYISVTKIIDDVLIVVNPSDSDPYNPNGEHAGGDGEEQNTDDMEDETLPTISASDTGFVTLYKPSISQMNALANYMWTTLDLDVFKKVIANPMDVILGLSILPGIVPSGGSSSVRVGNIDTGVSMTKVGNQYVKFNCGSVTIKRKWGAFLDYSPFTKAFIYLPFIGVQPIDVDEIMNKTVSVTYNIDVLSGGCCAFIKVNDTTLYTYIGQCACSVPVTGKDWSTMINGVLGAVSSIGGTIGSIASGNVAGAISGVAAVAQNVMGAKPTYQRSGTMGGMGGMMGIKTPYIIIERPVQAVPGYQNHIIGYPSFITRMIGEFKGYTEIEQCHLENIPCTKDEMIEIENILKTGVIL